MSFQTDGELEEE